MLSIDLTDFINRLSPSLFQVYPWWTYSYLVALVPIFLLTDLLLYKPILVLESVGYIVFRSTLVFGSSVLTQQIGQAWYGVASASEIAFYSYIYARVDKSAYREFVFFLSI